MTKKGWIVAGGVAAVVIAAGGFFFFSRGKQPVSYRTAAVTRGDLKVQVTATGSLNSFVTVQVGTQVSGTVANHADQKAGQIKLP